MLQQVPGVGPLTSLAFVLTLGDPTRFANSRVVGAYCGLTPGRRQSGSRGGDQSRSCSILVPLPRLLPTVLSKPPVVHVSPQSDQSDRPTPPSGRIPARRADPVGPPSRVSVGRRLPPAQRWACRSQHSIRSDFPGGPRNASHTSKHPVAALIGRVSAYSIDGAKSSVPRPPGPKS